MKVFSPLSRTGADSVEPEVAKNPCAGGTRRPAVQTRTPRKCNRQRFRCGRNRFVTFMVGIGEPEDGALLDGGCQCLTQRIDLPVRMGWEETWMGCTIDLRAAMLRQRQNHLVERGNGGVAAAWDRPKGLKPCAGPTTTDSTSSGVNMRAVNSKDRSRQ